MFTQAGSHHKILQEKITLYITLITDDGDRVTCTLKLIGCFLLRHLLESRESGSHSAET